MNTPVKFTISCLLGLALSVVMSQCKSPVAPVQVEAQVTHADTTAAVVVADTTKSVAAPLVKAAVHIPLTLIIRNLASPTAPVVAGLYGTTNKFLDPKDQLKEYHFTPNGKELVAKIEDIQFGVYAMAIYQDVNSNGKIDKNVIGIPTEPYAFSNNYHPRIKAPGFDNCKFEYDSVSNTVTMTMIK